MKLSSRRDRIIDFLECWSSAWRRLSIFHLTCKSSTSRGEQQKMKNDENEITDAERWFWIVPYIVELTRWHWQIQNVSRKQMSDNCLNQFVGQRFKLWTHLDLKLLELETQNFSLRGFRFYIYLLRSPQTADFRIKNSQLLRLRSDTKLSHLQFQIVPTGVLLFNLKF